MKKCLAIACLFMLFSSVSFGRGAEKREFESSPLTIGLCPIGLYNHIGLMVETPLSYIAKTSPNAFSVGSELQYYYGLLCHNVNIQPLGRWYFSNKQAGKGLYLQAKIMLGMCLETPDREGELYGQSGFMGGAGAGIGWKIPIAKHWSVDMNAGLKFNNGYKVAYGYQSDNDDDALAITPFGFGAYNMLESRLMIVYRF